MSGEQKPIAIVGMACRFPKGLESLEALWNALKNRVSAIDQIPSDRWSVDRYYSSNPIAKGKSYIQRGGFLTQDITKFDAGFFGISPRDAENMDPQQRILLEVVWEAFENSGMILPDFSGKSVGVYVGGFMLDHMITQMSASNRSAINQNTAAGMMMTMLSNRISHTFDFRGPSLSIDTACSSSLVAFHYACQDLWCGHSEMAVVGGANMMLRPEYPMGMCKGHFLSRDGECKSFDARGDGYGRGEGAGVVLLKPLDAAIRDGDCVLATVIATGSNQDGRTPGISMPSGDAQRTLIESVCQRNDVDPSSVCYVECHGTGTAVGDPTESKAIGATYGYARQKKGLGPVIVGSVKSNIGHLEAAAGVAGVIKATLTLLHRETTPLANLQEPNAAINLSDLNVRLSDDAIPLNTEGDIRVAINSFGYGGTNAHVILQSAPRLSKEEVCVPEVSSQPAHSLPRLLPISARSVSAVEAAAGKYADLLQSDCSLEDIIYSAAHHRAHLNQRAVVKGSCKQEIIDALKALSNGVEHPNVVTGSEPFTGIRKPVFVYTGMGPQWWAMGQELYEHDPIYRQAVIEADEIFESISGFSILKEMSKSEAESQITRTEFAQPANFIIQIGLTAVLRAAGVHPGAVVGHSVGELASAYTAGVLTLSDALTVCYHRSRLQASCRGTGGMLAVGLSKEGALAKISGHADKVSIAAVNGPTNVTIAGDIDILTDIANELTQAGIFNRHLDVEVPYHSPMMDPILGELKIALLDVRPSVPCVPLYSTVTGGLVQSATYGSDYWPENVRQPVEFATAIASLLEAGFNTFLEVGPHPVLSTSIRDCVKIAGKDSRQAFTLRKNVPELEAVHKAVMSVYAEGCDIDWNAHAKDGRFVSLPNYSWQREFYWNENDRAKQDRIASVEYPMLGIQEAPGAPVYRNDFDHEPVLYLRDHVITGMPILPAAGYVESLLELASIQFPGAIGLAVRDAQILAPMIITAERGLDCVTDYDQLSQSAVIRSLENGRLGAGQVHMTAKLVGLPRFENRRFDLDSFRSQICLRKDIDSFYKGLDQIGLSYGPAFRSVKELRTNSQGSQVLACIEMLPELTWNLKQYCLHPTILDACFQSLMLLLQESETTYLPTGFGELCLYGRSFPEKIWCLSECVDQNERQIICNMMLMDEEGNVLAALRSMRLNAATKRERVDQWGDRVKRQILTYDWSYGENLTEPKRLGHWVVVGCNDAHTKLTVEQLEAFGSTVVGIVDFGEKLSCCGRQYTLRSSSVEDAKFLLQQVGELDGLVFLNGINAIEQTDDATAEKAITEITAVTQALLAHQSLRKPRVYVVTKEAFAINDFDRTVQPSQAAINGFVRVAFNELDELRFSSIDLPAKLNDKIAENLILELLCDADEDEVALRGSLRLFSELKDSSVLSTDRVVTGFVNEQHPVLVRALRPDCESVGTARVVSTSLREVGDYDALLEIETTYIPNDLLNGSAGDAIQQPAIEIVARVLQVGREVTDLRPGVRVCGFAPSDLASHMVARRDEFRVVEIDDEVDAVDVTGVIGNATRAYLGVKSIDASSHKRAVVLHSSFGIAIANELAQQNYEVTLLIENKDQCNLDLSRFSVFSACPEGIADAVKASTGGRGFDVVAVPLFDWQKTFDMNLLASGGVLLDLDSVASGVTIPRHARSIVRTDYKHLSRNDSDVEIALQEIVKRLEAKAIVPDATLEVSISDLAWRKLPLGETSATLILNWETHGGDLPIVQTDELKFASEGSYLITGGFGGFGQKTAEWLIENGAQTIVLTGRTGADTPSKKAFVSSLEKRGARVVSVACDTSDFTQLQLLFDRFGTELPALKGVFHSGAQIIDQPISDIDTATFQKVMRSKATGAWNLHLLTKDLALDHFVLYSSIANLVGNSRQAAYSAANGFLNGLAHLRTLLGLPGVSVNWGAISDVGVVAQDEKLEQFLRYTGLRGISSTEALSVLQTGLARGVPQFGVTVISSWADWARFETRSATSPRFAGLIASDSMAQDSSNRDALIEELSSLEPADQVELLANLIIAIVASVLKADPASIPFDKSINSLGVDSLMATEIQSLLDSQLGLSISILELIGDSSIRTLAAQSLKSLNLVADVALAT